MSDEIWQLGVTALRDCYARGELSPRDVVDALAERIAETDPLVRAFSTLRLDEAADEARQQSDELARGEVRGPLHGIPVAIKELFDVAGTVTTYGSVIFAGNRPAEDAAAVRSLRSAGAIVIGLTRSHEFGWGITTQHEVLGGTRNPWNPSRVPGGSSGGSAAALATGMVPLALGTDTGGSIRIPACYCGVAGLKPTYGRVSAAGLVPLAPSLDHPGPMARRIGDLVVAMRALMLWSPGPATGRDELVMDRPASPDETDLHDLSVGLVPDLHLRPLRPDHQRIFDRAVAALAGRGATIRSLSFAGAEQMRPDFSTIQMAEARHVHSSILGLYPQRRADYGADVRGRLDAAGSVTLGAYLTAQDGARRAAGQFASLLRHVDVLLTPITSGGPAEVASPDEVMVGGRTTAFRDVVMDYTVPQNLVGLPACAIPAGFDDDGIPVAVQLTGWRNREDLTLRVAGALEAGLCEHGRWPLIAPPPGRHT